MIEIPLKNGTENSHQKFSMKLGDNFLEFELNYLTYLENTLWTLDIYRDGAPLILGAWLIPNGELTEFSNIGIGRLIFVGDRATINNIGLNNKLVWLPS